MSEIFEIGSEPLEFTKEEAHSKEKPKVYPSYETIRSHLTRETIDSWAKERYELEVYRNGGVINE